MVLITVIFFLVAASLFSQSKSSPYVGNNIIPPSNAYDRASRFLKTNHLVINPVERPLLIGSFNIQTFGNKKFTNPDVIYTIEKIVERYDLILIQELMSSEEIYLQKFLRELNMFVPDGVVYNMTVSDRHNSTREHCAFLYRTNKLRVIATESYADRSKFFRKPFIVIFEALTLRDMKKFGVIGHHVKPDKAVREIDALADVYDHTKFKFGIEDVLLMGDFNADCSYVKENDWKNISLWTRPEFTWAITSDMDTTTNYKSCTLDRFVYAGENINDGVILSSAKVFNYQQAFELTIEETRKISDHWPIEIKIRGKMSDVAAKHLTSEICFKIQDTQKRRNITKDEVMAAAKKVHFETTFSKKGIFLSNKTREEADILSSVRNLRVALPAIMTYEMEEAIKYKIRHGSLKDDSSFADIWNPGYRVSVISASSISTALVCKMSSVN